MAQIELHPDFRDFLRLLNSHSVEYLVVGGYAVGYHGYPCATGDLENGLINRQPGQARSISLNLSSDEIKELLSGMYL
jgi:hypothetical protein